jgi:hypothetical protein
LTRGNVLLVLLMVLGGIFAWNRDVAHAVRNAELDRQNEAVRERSRTWRQRYAAAAEGSRRVDTVVVSIREGAEGALAAADSTAEIIEALVDQSPALAQTNWKRLYELRSLEVDRLRHALTLRDQQISLLEQDRNQWRALASAAAPIMEDTEAVLEAEQDARGCDILGIIPMPCVSNTIKVLAIATASAVTWEQVVRPTLRMP